MAIPAVSQKKGNLGTVAGKGTDLPTNDYRSVARNEDREFHILITDFADRDVNSSITDAIVNGAPTSASTLLLMQF